MHTTNTLKAALFFFMAFNRLQGAEKWENQEVITNISRADGFGAQFQSIIYAAIYAELNNKKFVYSPFRSMDHNYDRDPTFLKKKEEFINFIGHFELNDDVSLQPPVSHQLHCHFFEANLTACQNSQTLKKIKEIFRQNKNKENYFRNGNLNIAVHVRRPNPHDVRLEGADTPDATYLRTIDLLRSIYAAQSPLFHIYSQGDVDSFQKLFGAADTVLHINQPIEDTFASMVFADVLVTCPSSFSYVAGILSEGPVYYMPFWHPPLPSWIVLK